MARAGGESAPPQILSTHPSSEARVANLQKLVPQMLPLYQAARKSR
jgi:predicted Zn-dependent protease